MLQNIKFTAFTVYELLRKNLARERENTQAWYSNVAYNKGDVW